LTFSDLKLSEPILKALEDKGYTNPTPIQEQSIPILLKGTDLLGCAQTGTGKTAAFAIPIIQNILTDQEAGKGFRGIKALIVTPTRELAIQIADNFTAYSKYTDLKTTVIFGGVKQHKQVKILGQGVDILVATPGRLLDLMNQGYIDLKKIKYFVLDEADHMLDMGFIHDIRKVVAAIPEKRQSLFFSATMPMDIMHLAHKILDKHEKVTIKPEQATAERVEQLIYFVTKKWKTKLLIHLLETEPRDTTLVFSRTKHGANKIVRKLEDANIKAAAIHGNKSQATRQRALHGFKNGDIKVLVATDIAARGIDVSDLSQVINLDLPNVPETYVHRIGRTGRASASGRAISFCNAEEREYLKDIEKLIKQEIPVVADHKFESEALEEVRTYVPAKAKKKKHQRVFPKSSGKPKQHKYGRNNNSGRGQERRSNSR
jgi:ATP-dependent RNA helicase RhlE